MFGYSREAVRVKVKKCNGNLPVEQRKFSVDPEITSFEVLQSILAKAFDLKNDFTICFRIYDINGYETYMPILSDWDLDAAFLKAHNVSVATNTEPCLSLRVDLKFEESSDDWDIKQNVNIITQIRTANTSQEAKPSPRLHGIINQVGKTLNLVQRAFNFGEDGNAIVHPPRPPLSDAEFRKFLDPIGQIVYAKELRSVIYFGGIEPSLRKVVWKHLLNVYPDGMSGKERMDYIKKKAAEYINLREIWKNAIGQGGQVGELAYTTGMVRKDVLRTDRHHPFYAGSDDNQNIASLFNILTTYALNHPKVSYCQGMSDLASPLLVTMNDEAHAYICFCALMQRLSSNFMIDGIAMTQKFTHLAEGILYYDPEFYNYLKLHQADDLLFCYRWLLLEMKREFAFDDSLRMLEVLWSSLPADPPNKELKLFDSIFQPIPNSPPAPIKTPRENAYTKMIALRRQSSSISLNKKSNSSSIIHRQNHSLDESITINNKSKFIAGKYQSLDDGALRSINFNSIDERKCGGGGGRKRNFDLSSSMTNLIKNSSSLRNKNGGHFKDLKEKLFSSLERLDGDNGIKEEEDNGKNTYQGRLVKNLNEFKSLKSNTKPVEEEKPTKSSLDSSESSTFSRNLSSPSSSTSSEEYSPLMTSVTRELRLEIENLDRTVFGDKKSPINKNNGVFIWENPLHHFSKDEEQNKDPLHHFSKDKQQKEENTPDEQAELEYDEHMMNSCEEIKEDLMKKSSLPSPNEFGGGNPFLMFLCITVLLQHRDHIIGKSMDYNETAMHFDKMVRKHNVCRVLNQARQMYARYMKQQTINAAVSYQKKTNNEDC